MDAVTDITALLKHPQNKRRQNKMNNLDLSKFKPSPLDTAVFASGCGRTATSQFYDGEIVGMTPIGSSSGQSECSVRLKRTYVIGFARTSP